MEKATVEATVEDTAEVAEEAKEVTVEVPMEAEADQDGWGVSQEGDKCSPPGVPNVTPPVLHIRDVRERAMSQQHVPIRI
jgi:hypothetical protein